MIFDAVASSGTEAERAPLDADRQRIVRDDNALSLKRLYVLQAQAKEQAGDLVVTVAVDSAAADAAIASLEAALGPKGSLIAAMAGSPGLRVAPDSLRVLPPASDE